jgi:hypothetical protein
VQQSLQWESNKYYIFWVCVRVLRYPAWNTHAPHCQWSVQLYSIFLHFLINSMIFGKKKLLNKKCFLIFYTTLVWKICQSKKNWVRYDGKCILVFVWSTRHSCQILTQFEISRQVVEKYSNIRFHENPSSGSRVVPCGRTGRHRSLNAIMAQSKNCPLVVNTTIEFKNITASDNNGI